MKPHSVTVLAIVFSVLASASASAAEPVKIGAYYADALNGIAFISDDQAAFLLRVGWVTPDQGYRNGYLALSDAIHKFGMAAPDGSVNRVSWKVGNANVRFDWGRHGASGVVGRITADGPVRVVLETNQPWEFECAYHSVERGLKGIAQVNGKTVTWRLLTRQTPVARLCADDPLSSFHDLVARGQSNERPSGENAALLFDLRADSPLLFAAGFDSPTDLSTVGAILADAEDRYQARRARAAGDWGVFIEPITNNLNCSQVYNFKSHRIAHTISRAWCRDDNATEPAIDGQVLFAWDSFFNGLLASIEDPVGARRTVRAILATQQENGLIPNMAGPRRGVTADRTQFPIGSMCVWKMHHRWPDRDFLTEVYPKLKRWHDWWFSKRPSNGLVYRDGNRNGLIEHGSETGFFLDAKYEGLDDTPAYDYAKMNRDSRTMELDAVGMSAIWAMDAEYLSLIAQELGEQRDAERFRREWRGMNDRLNRHLWNEKLGMYCDRYWGPESRVDRREGDRLSPECLVAPSGEQGLKGEYFSGINFDTPGLTRIDREIGTATVSGIKEVGDRYFSVRWTGKLKPERTGQYVFSLTCNDGGRLWIDGREAITDNWKGHQKFVNISEPILLERGRSVDVRLEYFQGGGAKYLRFGWYRHEPKPTDQDLFSEKLTPLNFFPLLSGAPDEARAKRMLAVLQDPKKFWGEYVCPTIARDDPTFPEQQYWRGAIWSITNYLVYQGLRRYAEPELCNAFAEKSVALFMKSWLTKGTCHENFYADGRGAKDPHYTLGALLCLTGVENVCDIEPDGTVRLNGTLGCDVEMRNIPLFGRAYNIRATRGRAELLLEGRRVLDARGRIGKKRIPLE